MAESTQTYFSRIVEHYLSPSQAGIDPPQCIVMLGPPATGKSTLRRQKYSEGYTLVDASAIFIELSQGHYLDFPGPLEELMEIVGQRVADRAVAERRNIVTEVIGTDVASVKAMIDALLGAEYKVQVESVQCELEEAVRRNEARGEDNVSAYYSEPYQKRWLQVAAKRYTQRRAADG